MPVPFHAPPQHGAVQNVKRGEQGGGAVALVIMGHGGAFARLQRQARLGAVQGLHLGLFIDTEDHGAGGRIDVQADDVADLGGELRIVGKLEGADPVRG